MQRVVFCCFLVLLFPMIAASEEPLTLRLTQTLTISDETESTTFCVHPATDEASRITGLMFQKTLPENAGMVFDFGKMQIVHMWMRNTILPLDMIFFDNNGVVVSIEENTIPFSLDIISSNKPAQFVLEVNAGAAKKQGLNVGDKVVLGDHDCQL